MRERTDAGARRGGWTPYHSGPLAPSHPTPGMADLDPFLARWAASQASERANYQTFLAELADVLGLARPDPSTGIAQADGYVFDRAVAMLDTGSATTGYIDLYKRGCFVLETKQGADRRGTDASTGGAATADAPKSARRAGHGTRGTAAWERALTAAKAQAQRYAQNLGAREPIPTFLVVCDVGYCIDLYADFSGSGRSYTPFPDARTFRIPLADLAKEDVRETLRLVWTDPTALDPTRRQARVTRTLATQLARLSTMLEASVPAARRPEIPRFVTRCLFCLFAEDTGLIPERGFSRLLDGYRGSLDVVEDALATFFATLDAGGFSPEIKARLRRFNGDLFRGAAGMPLSEAALDLLLEAGRADWRQVEPAIFGTLLERALNPAERHKLGAHFTPRAYVERLVLPTVIEPLRREWEATQAAVARVETLAEARASARTTRSAADDRTARTAALAELQRFQMRLASVRVLDPACGSGNFLYVTLDHLKRLEAEVRVALERYGAAGLEMETAAVTPANLLGLEMNPQAAALADLVLWIGYLQWHLRTYGSAQSLPDPVLRAYGNIAARDAVLAPGTPVPRVDADGQAVTRWDGVTTKTHPVTGREVPDESARVAMVDFPDARQAEPWPTADFIVGNPPFIGAGPMREALGDGYVEALRRAYPDVPDSADFVMYWWERAAQAVRAGTAERFGFITTNSLRQTFNRRVLERHLGADASPLHLTFAVPDHPWVDSADGAQVRIALTVAAPGAGEGTLARVRDEATLDEDDAHMVTLDETRGHIHADLTVGADVVTAEPLNANARLSNRGVQLFGAGFIVTPSEAAALGLGTVTGADSVVKPYRNGRDLTSRPRGAYVIDLFGLSEDEARTRFPAIYQRLLTTVKPERDQNNRATYRDNWWTFGEPRRELRRQVHGLPRYIATAETAKHRFFQFLDGSVLPDNALVAIATDDAYHLGVLSSRVHVAWALAQGGRLGVGNDPRYNKTRCFETFPFPDATPEQQASIRALGEAIDAHRKARQAAHPALALTDLYNVVEALRAGRVLTAKERATHEAGLASVLLDLHTRLDAAVLAAYGWPASLPDADVLARLAALNATRRAEEAAGHVRWLRPAFQAPQSAPVQGALGVAPSVRAAASVQAPAPLPGTLAGQLNAVRSVVESSLSGVTPSDVASAFAGLRPALAGELLAALAELGLVRDVGGRYA